MQILENNAVRSIEFNPDVVLVNSDQGVFRAQVLVGADGSNGVARRYIRRMEKAAHTARLLETLVPGRDEDYKFIERYAWFDFTPVRKNLQGYFWDFPSRYNGEPVYNRGIYDARMDSGKPKADLTQLMGEGMDRLRSDTSDIPWEGHPIHWFTPGNIFSISRMLLVGDAAGAEPLFGEGIAPALAVGQVTADAIQAAFNQDDFNFRDYRRRLLSSKVGIYLLVRWWTAFWCYHLGGKPGFMPLLWSIGNILVRVWRPKEEIY